VFRLQQLTDCLPLLFPGAIKSGAKPAASDEDEEMADEEEGEAPEPATVVVDLLLELLHRPSAFVKGVAQNVFTGFAGELGAQGMELLLEVRCFFRLVRSLVRQLTHSQLS
jgi:DNA polymerase phi